MADERILESFLAKEGFALFERVGDGVFRPMGAFPAWLARTWGARIERAKTVRLGEHSAFLENFLLDAEEFWKAEKDGAVNSGNWIERGEKGDETPLEAAAFWLDRKPTLLIRNFLRSFGEQKEMLQTARDSILAHERLMREIQKKEILLHCIIHDLSQPLSAMRGCFHCLTIGDLPADLRKFAVTGQRESERQEQMIRGILQAFAGELSGERSNSGPSPDAVDLAARAQFAVESFSAAFGGKGIGLRVDPGLDRSRAWISVGDPSRVDRIVGNLLENALRYSPCGTTVTVGLEERDDSVLFFVDDQGPGLPKDQTADKLFALFSKGSHRPGKAGLGLYFCRMTVERWGGTIGAEAGPQGGSRFWFRLPRAPAAADERKPHVRESSEPQAPRARRELPKAANPLRILVADDTETNRELTMELLRTRGHSAVGVADGREALAALRKQSFDVVLMDEVMPEMNGIEATRTIRREESSSGRHQVIFGLTGNAAAEDEKRFAAAGMDAFLSKPFDMFKLFDLVESAGATGTPLPSPARATEPNAPAEDVLMHLTRATAGNAKLIRSLVKSFLGDAPKRISDIRRALAQRSSEKLAATAHALKGSVAIFGAPDAVAAARSLEAMGNAGALQGAAQEFTALQKQLDRLRLELLAILPAPAKSKSGRKAPARAKK